MNELISRKRVPALFVTVPELLDNMRGAYNDPGRDRRVDGLGQERRVAAARRPAPKGRTTGSGAHLRHRQPPLPRRAADHLYVEHRAEDLAAQLGERTASRIIAMCDWISLEGEDYREAEVRRGL